MNIKIKTSFFKFQCDNLLFNFTKLVEYSLEMYMKNIKGNSKNRIGKEIGEDTDFKNGQQTLFII